MLAGSPPRRSKGLADLVVKTLSKMKQLFFRHPRDFVTPVLAAGYAYNQYTYPALKFYTVDCNGFFLIEYSTGIVMSDSRGCNNKKEAESWFQKRLTQHGVEDLARVIKENQKNFGIINE